MDACAQVKVALFDYDGTITSTDTVKFLLASLAFRRPQRIAGVLYLYVRYRMRKISMQVFKTLAIGLLLRGRSTANVEKGLGPFCKFTAKKHRSSILSRMNELSGQGYRVIVATASPDFAVKAALVPMPVEVIGTAFETTDGKYTGTASGMACHGEEKRRRIEEYLGKENLLCIELAFSDHEDDAPMLGLANSAFMVSKTGEVLPWK